MTIRALAEGNSHVPWFLVGTGSMALSASSLRMQTGERISGQGMVELADADALPVCEVMALQAVGAEASFVLILVAGGATGRDS
jgi:hypothetical protein